MGRKKMNREQAEKALEAVEDSFKTFNSIYSLIHDNHPKSARNVRKYYTVWRHLREFLDLMELEVERVS